MSGPGSDRGSSGDWRQPAGGKSGPDKCAISERTVLNSPDQAVVATLKVGAILEVRLETAPRKRLVAVAASNKIAGSITSARLVDFIECIEGGSEYVADVLSIQGGRVEIEVRPK
ncbi:MAG: hypothetical protein ABUS57_01130 [Pseudomonadota bacterium]